MRPLRETRIIKTALTGKSFCRSGKRGKGPSGGKSRGWNNQRLLYYPETYRYYSSGTKKISASRISTDTASAVYKTSEKGTCYYQVIEAGAKVPALDTSGKGTEVLAGTNTITLTGLSSGEKDLVIVVKDAAGNVSDSLVMGIPDIKQPVPLETWYMAPTMAEISPRPLSQDKTARVPYPI